MNIHIYIYINVTKVFPKSLCGSFSRREVKMFFFSINHNTISSHSIAETGEVSSSKKKKRTQYHHVIVQLLSRMHYQRGRECNTTRGRKKKRKRERKRESPLFRSGFLLMGGKGGGETLHYASH